jgi:hypothetical protein
MNGSFADNRVATAVVLVTLMKLLGAVLQGPVGAIIGGFVGVVIASGSIPPTRRFVWSAVKDGQETVLGPCLFTDEAAFQAHKMLEDKGFRLVRYVQADDRWLRDSRSCSLRGVTP